MVGIVVVVVVELVVGVGNVPPHVAVSVPSHKLVQVAGFMQQYSLVTSGSTHQFPEQLPPFLLYASKHRSYVYWLLVDNPHIVLVFGSGGCPGSGLIVIGGEPGPVLIVVVGELVAGPQHS